MSTNQEIVYESTTTNEVDSTAEILCNDVVILCDTEDYNCDGSV